MATLICLICNQQHLRLLHLLTHLIYPNFQLPDPTFKGAVTSNLVRADGKKEIFPNIPLFLADVAPARVQVFPRQIWELQD